MLERNNTGLIVIDIQGKLAQIVTQSDSLISQTSKLIQGANILGLPIIYVEQNPAKLGATHATLQHDLTPLQPIVKYTFDACGQPDFVAAIQQSQITTWLVCGIEAHICVYQTVSSLLQLGMRVELVEDCIASRALSHKTLAINKLTAQGAGITCVEMCLYELVVDCRVPEFKAILQLIK